MTRSQSLLPVALWSVLALPLAAQNHETEHTFRYTPGDARPQATLKDAAWLQGAWEGAAFGGTSQEIWSDARGGSMMGSFRSMEKGAVSFYEIIAIVETEGSLEMKLKHFHPDLTGWEEKNEVRKFPLVRLAHGELYFDGITYKKTGKDTVKVYVAIKGKDGKAREVSLEYRRKRL